MDKQVLLIIGAMAVVTYIPRMAPLLLLSGRQLPRPVMTWLGLLPAALLGALVAQAIIMPDGVVDVSWTNPAIIPALVSGVAAWRFRNLGITVLTGMAAAGVVHVIMGS